MKFWIKNVFLWSKMMKIFPKPRNLQLISIYVWIGTLIRGRGFVLDFRLNFWINPKSTRSHSGVLTLSSESTQNLPKINPIAFWSFDFILRINPFAFWSIKKIKINPKSTWNPPKTSKSTQIIILEHKKIKKQPKINPKSTQNQPKFWIAIAYWSKSFIWKINSKSTQIHLHLVWYPVRDDSRP